MRPRASSLACLLYVAGLLGSTTLGSASSPARAQDRPLEALVAVVGAETPSAGADLVLLSDVELVAGLAQARAGEATSRPTPALLSAALDQIVGEILIRRESSRLGTAEPTPDEIARQREAIARSVGGEAALSAVLGGLSASPDEIDVLARRRAVVERFLGANLEGASEVTEADLEEAYAEARHPFAGRPLDEVRDALRAWLRVTLLDAYVARWLGTLRRRTTVHVLRPFVAAPAVEASDVGAR